MEILAFRLEQSYFAGYFESHVGPVISQILRKNEDISSFVTSYVNLTEFWFQPILFLDAEASSTRVQER